ncbi:MAG: Wadjet anti-phage system protein JetA family protein, partial [Anaerolineales bacterium]
MAANPFDVLPANLFNLFSTQGYTTLQRHYMTLLLRLYTLAEFNRFGLTREIAIAEIVDYLKAAGAEAEVAAEMAAQSDQAAGEANPITGQKPEHEYAAFILRRLAETGWVEREQHADYSETIILPDYAFTLLEALRAIQEQKPREFSGQLYTAHQLLTSSRNKDFSPALALTQAYENVRQVVRGLNELNQNIRRYIERATRGRAVAELLRLQFDDYSQTLGPAYHALKTSDHVSRYRRDIVGKLQSWQRNAEWLDRAADELAAQGRFTPAQASQEIGHVMQFIVHQLEGLDP